MQLNYAARDFNQNVAALTEFVQSVAPALWNSYFVGDLGQVLLESIAADSVLTGYLLDSATQECFIDTLQHRESVIHFSRLNGYQLRRASAVTMRAYAHVSAPPIGSDAYVIGAGTQLKSKDGQVWEVAADAVIAAPNFTPVSTELEYSVAFNFLISLTQGSAIATLMVRQLDNSLIPATAASAVFTPLVNQGSVLKLLSTYDSTSGLFGAAPGFVRDEFAIVDIGQSADSAFPGTALYLDRPWDGDTNWAGQWRVENRNVTIRQGQTNTETFTSTGGPNYQIVASLYPVLAGGTEPMIVAGSTISGPADYGVTVMVNGTAWFCTPSLLFQQADDLAYELKFDELDRMTVIFGDGMFGASLSNGDTVSIEYRTGGGRQGNVVQNAIDTTVVAFLDAQPSTPVTVYIGNPYTVGRGGQDRETVAQAKRNIPAYVRTNDRGVTEPDWDYLASNFSDASAGRIALAKSVLNCNTVPKELNIVWVYAWVYGENGQLAAPTYDLKARLLDYLNARKMIGTEVVVVDGPVTVAPLQVRYRYAQRSNNSTTLAGVQAAINGVFMGTAPGTTLYVSQLYEAIMLVDGVTYTDVHAPSSNLVPANAFELFTNSLQVPQFCTLSVAAQKGDMSIVCSNPSIMAIGGMVGLFGTGKQPSAVAIDSIVGNVINLRSPLLDSYPTSATLINSDFLIASWAYERAVNVYVRYTAGSSQTILNDLIKQVVGDYFRQSLMPEQPLVRTTLSYLIQCIPGVTAVWVGLGSVDQTTEQISPSVNELIVLGVLSVNNQVV